MLQAARNQKLNNIAAAQATAGQQAFENQLALDKLTISSSKSSTVRVGAQAVHATTEATAPAAAQLVRLEPNLFGNNSAAQTAANNSSATADSASNISALEYQLSKIERGQSKRRSKQSGEPH